MSNTDYAELRTNIEKAGLTRHEPFYYVWSTVLNVVLLTASYIALACTTSLGAHVVLAIFIGTLYVRFTFLSHDCVHRQVFASARANDTLGLIVSSLFGGFSYLWWYESHTAHHANPNHEDHDPDIHFPLLAFSEKQIEEKPAYLNWFLCRQAWFFFPVMLTQGISIRTESTKFLISSKPKWWLVELVLLQVNAVWIMGLTFILLEPARAVITMIVMLATISLYVGLVFAPNHKGMPVLDGKVNEDFLRKQVLTSRNVHSNWFTHYMYGGVNLQIEHHLFPGIPRNKLRASQEIVKSFCEAKKVPYMETGAFQSYWIVLQYLHELGATQRAEAANRVTWTKRILQTSYQLIRNSIGTWW